MIDYSHIKRSQSVLECSYCNDLTIFDPEPRRSDGKASWRCTICNESYVYLSERGNNNGRVPLP